MALKSFTFSDMRFIKPGDDASVLGVKISNKYLFVTEKPMYKSFHILPIGNNLDHRKFSIWNDETIQGYLNWLTKDKYSMSNTRSIYVTSYISTLQFVSFFDLDSPTQVLNHCCFFISSLLGDFYRVYSVDYCLTSVLPIMVYKCKANPKDLTDTTIMFVKAMIKSIYVISSRTKDVRVAVNSMLYALGADFDKLIFDQSDCYPQRLFDSIGHTSSRAIITDFYFKTIIEQTPLKDKFSIRPDKYTIEKCSYLDLDVFSELPIDVNSVAIPYKRVISSGSLKRNWNKAKNYFIDCYYFSIRGFNTKSKYQYSFLDLYLTLPEEFREDIEIRLPNFPKVFPFVCTVRDLLNYMEIEHDSDKLTERQSLYIVDVIQSLKLNVCARAGFDTKDYKLADEVMVYQPTKVEEFTKLSSDKEVSMVGVLFISCMLLYPEERELRSSGFVAKFMELLRLELPTLSRTVEKYNMLEYLSYRNILDTKQKNQSFTLANVCTSLKNLDVGNSEIANKILYILIATSAKNNVIHGDKFKSLKKICDTVAKSWNGVEVIDKVIVNYNNEHLNSNVAIVNSSSKKKKGEEPVVIPERLNINAERLSSILVYTRQVHGTLHSIFGEDDADTNKDANNKTKQTAPEKSSKEVTKKTTKKATKQDLTATSLESLDSDSTTSVASVTTSVADKTKSAIKTSKTNTASKSDTQITDKLDSKSTSQTTSKASEKSVDILTIAKALTEREQWSNKELKELASSFGLMTSVLIDKVNTWTDDTYGDFLIDEEDLSINEDIKEQLG